MGGLPHPRVPGPPPGRRARTCPASAPRRPASASLIAAMEEFRAEARLGDRRHHARPGDPGLRLDWQDPGRFEAYTSYLQDQAREDAPRRPGYVPSTTLWWVDGDEDLAVSPSGTG